VPIPGVFSCRSDARHADSCRRSCGEVPERSNGAVSQTATAWGAHRNSGQQTTPTAKIIPQVQKFFIIDHS
jgi:hypothetical protein